MSYENITINHTSRFTNNYANEQGGDFYLADSSGFFVMERTSIKNLISKDSLHLSRVRLIMQSISILSKFIILTLIGSPLI